MNKREPLSVHHRGGAMAVLLGVGAVLYVLLAAGCAGYLLWHAYQRGSLAFSDFDKLAIAGLIAVIGTGLTGFAAIYSATRQSATAYQVAEYGGVISRDLAQLKETSDKSLAEMKGRLDDTLTRLKVALDAGQAAHLELFGSATTYYYALRSVGLGRWDVDGLKAAESAMTSATRHLIHVDEAMRDEWFRFWQRAQEITRKAVAAPNPHDRPQLVSVLIQEAIDKDIDPKERNLRDIQRDLECIAKHALKNISVPAA